MGAADNWRLPMTAARFKERLPAKDMKKSIKNKGVSDESMTGFGYANR